MTSCYFDEPPPIILNLNNYSFRNSFPRHFHSTLLIKLSSILTNHESKIGMTSIHGVLLRYFWFHPNNALALLKINVFTLTIFLGCTLACFQDVLALFVEKFNSPKTRFARPKSDKVNDAVGRINYSIYHRMLTWKLCSLPILKYKVEWNCLVITADAYDGVLKCHHRRETQLICKLGGIPRFRITCYRYICRCWYYICKWFLDLDFGV